MLIKRNMMKPSLFKKEGWLYLPVHPMGFLISCALIFFLLMLCLACTPKGRPVNDDLMYKFVYLTPAAF